MKITQKQHEVIQLIKSKSLKKNPRGTGYAYHVPSHRRRSGLMLVTKGEINLLIKKSLIRAEEAAYLSS